MVGNICELLIGNGGTVRTHCHSLVAGT
jgi:hypothetical protein